MKIPVTGNNKLIALRFMQFVNEKNIDGMCKMISPTWQMLGGPPNLALGEAGIKQLFEHLATVEQEWTINDVVAENDLVVVRATNTCTQESFFGVPGKGRQQVFTAMFMHQVVNGKIEKTFRNADDLGRVFQLGGQVVYQSNN